MPDEKLNNTHLSDLRNNASIIGTLIRGPQIKQTKTGKLVCSFVIKNGTMDPTYVPITTWGQEAQKCSDFKEGTAVYVNGRLKTNSWKGVDGIRISKLQIVATKVELYSKLKEEEIDKVANSIKFKEELNGPRKN
ncbi:MAG: single-stranded DNA-binding protein [Endomicrobium sp.]|jgi:single-stranded DNA-binding protein|nr:single-stranded DNA-binding protein [Endomicrobium sp.]